MRFSTVLFDLDGTLTDSAPGIINSIVFALEKFGAEIPSAETLRKFVGPPLIDSYMLHCGFGREKAVLGVKYFREYFNVRGAFENSVYGGVPQMLDTLRAAGVRLAVATSKPEDFARRILEHFSLADRFDFIGGATFDETRTAKADVIEYTLAALGIEERAAVVMVGDREHDVLGAKAARIASVGVLYGYGERDELTAAGADHIAATPADVCSVILS